MINWTKEWPTSPGYYWFYGWCFRDRVRAPEPYYVKAVRDSTGRLSYITHDGHFLYKVEGGDGYWLPTVTPVLPDELFDSLVAQMEDE